MSLTASLPLFTGFLYSQNAQESKTISEVEIVSSLESVSTVSDSQQSLLNEMHELRGELEMIHQQALNEMGMEISEDLLLKRAESAHRARSKLHAAQMQWRKAMKETANRSGSEKSAPWHFPQISLFQLLNEIASQDYLYIIPQDLAAQKVSLLGGFDVPRDIWPELLDWILVQQGLGQRTINPLCRQIYRLNDEPLSIEAFTVDKGDLKELPPHMRLCLLLSLEQETFSFCSAIEKFARGTKVELRVIGGQIALIGRCTDLLSLLKICHLIASNAKEMTYRVISLRGIGIKDLQTALEDQIVKKSPAQLQSDDAGNLKQELKTAKLRLIPLMQTSGSSLLLIGSNRDIEHACKIIEEIEKQIETQSQYQLFWYLCKNEKPQVLADLAGQIAVMLKDQNEGDAIGKPDLFKHHPTDLKIQRDSGLSQRTTSSWKTQDLGQTSRIAFDSKSGYLVMSLPRQQVPKMQQALTRLDIPKKMVRIDFALLEHKMTDCNRSGIQLLRLGSLSSNTSGRGLSYSGDLMSSSGSRGILEFVLSKASRQKYLPSYDLAYHFLLSQENMQINANPSVLTINGVPAQLNLVEETSINSGVGKVEKSARTMQEVYQRAKYGIKISITPHIQHCNGRDFIALEADLSFDTRKASSDYRPDVSTRHIKTTVRVADGKSVILGGLKQKDLEDNREKVPFLGELPGIGKLFGTTLLIDKTTEMFLFITPKIIDSESAEKCTDLRFERADEPLGLRAKIELAQQNLNKNNLSVKEND